MRSQGEIDRFILFTPKINKKQEYLLSQTYSMRNKCISACTVSYCSVHVCVHVLQRRDLLEFIIGYEKKIQRMSKQVLFLPEFV